MVTMLPVEIEMGSLRVALEQQILEADWAQARFDQLNLLDERRLRAADHVRAYQRKMARAFKKRVRPKPLRIGDLVLKVIRGLIRDPRGKFRPNWSGPYFIRELTPEGAACPITTFLHISIVSLSFLSLLVIHLIPFTSYSPLTATHSQVHGSWGSLYMLHFIYEGMSFDHWVFEPSFLSFLSPYRLGLRYVPCLKTTLRPWDQMSSSQPLLGQICTIIITYWMLTETWTWSLPYEAPKIHPASFALLDAWMPSCLSIWEVTCPTIDDFMTLVLLTCHISDAILGHISVSDEIYGSSRRSLRSTIDDSCQLFFRPVVHPMPYWGIFPFWVRFTDLHGGHALDNR
ncbi:hypothetical protein CK203_051826 [Vitis vinifera]|uniref:Uncharacterized protein n=1 Tax=Vitis vinifera TaxID=29760 RepID=A0A438GUP2_VITVI|nr:hypothetical protein CK203_051826 [Vitis vinifera]